MKNILSLSLIVILITSIILVSGCTQVQNSVDTSVCDKLSYDEEYECYTKLAIRNGDVKICKKLLGSYGLALLCYSSYARATKDISVCENMVELCDDIIDIYEWGGKIYNNTESTQRNCREAWATEYKQPCYRYVAVALKDIEICNKITDYVEKKTCYSDVAKAMGLIS